ncbi:DUF6809 family protein [Paenibacillus ehimensis]|uniref:Uncharacterized protein n=1 Tax=Paenibacillus ehimensis TaxID=79264 RepID=A0ABT8VLG2_9BACL|nr:DUF6809 family protein [Paenibacillus ehimensis]MDO3681825.1 hypothetical protein [Paenibacillus ehimensis]
MKSILEELYNGNLCPVEQIVPDDPLYRATNHKITEAMSVWRERLTAEEYKQLEELLNLRVQTGAMDLKESFVHGFKLGAALMIEVLAGRCELTKQGE